MNVDLARALRDGHGALTRAAALRMASKGALDHAARAGVLIRLHPGVYAEADSLTPLLRMRAALAYVGPCAAVSHLSALHVWRLGAPPVSGIVHVTADRSNRLAALTAVSRCTAAPDSALIRLRSSCATVFR